MREIDEFVDGNPLQGDGVARELLRQASEYKKCQDKVSRSEAAASGCNSDLTNVVRQAFHRLAERDEQEATEVITQDFLQELSKDNVRLASKLKPVLSWVESIGIHGDDFDLRFNGRGGDRKGQPQWLREAVLAKDIDTHGLYIPKVLHGTFEDRDGKALITGLKGLEIPATVREVPIKIDRVSVKSIQLSLSGDRLRFDVEVRNPAPLFSRLLPPEKRRPNPIPVVVLLDDQGNLEMYESWKKNR